jgi:methylated-DNA-[protein]-cysteine S-methyltransferase
MSATILTMDTPDGPFTIISSAGAVLASGWTDGPQALVGQIHPTLLPDSFTTVPSLGPVSDAVTAYYDGELGLIGGIAVRQHSGPFRSRAWEVLRAVRPGSPVSYTDYAALSGNPKAVRAAASACAFNAAALFVPCHRVLRNDGSLGGFRWGLPLKESLLAREAAAL